MQPENGSRISFAFFWSTTLFHVKHTAQAFLPHRIQLRGEGKEVAFLPQPSFDTAAPVGTRPSGCSGDAKAKQLGRVALAFPVHGGVWA